ncbi:MAG: cation:proton antiporter [Candidatus Bathyarchaeia archaeon]
MKRSYLMFILIMVIIAASSMILQALPGETDTRHSRLKGYVYEVVEGVERPVSNAKVSIYNGSIILQQQWTSRNGSYSFDLQSGNYTVRVEAGRRIPREAHVILAPDVTVQIDFQLEARVEPYEVYILIHGLPEGFHPGMRLDGGFYGYALNGSILSFKGGSIHVVELSRVEGDRVRFIPKEPFRIVGEGGSITFEYIREFYIGSGTNPWISGWYDEGSLIRLEARDVIDLGNMTRLIFDHWIMDGRVMRDNPLTLMVDSAFRVDSEYRRQYLITVYSDKGIVMGGGWYDEKSTAQVSVSETEVGVMPSKYMFKGWRGDLESPNATITVDVDGPKSLYAEWERVQPVEVERLDPIYKAIIGMSLLISAAKILGGVFHRVGLPEVLGELSAGMLLSPNALGGIMIRGEPLIELNEYVIAFAEIGAILLLFIAGLEMGFGRFREVGGHSAVVGVSGVVVPFFLGLYVMRLLGFPWNVSLLVASTLTATSIAITVRLLESVGRLHSIEGVVMINSAVIDDVLGLVVLAVVTTMVTAEISLKLFDVIWLLSRAVILWIILLASVLAVAPRIVGVAERWKVRGTVETFSTATCFGSAVAAAAMGLSPIVGAFAAGMALASSRVIGRIRDYIERLSILFSPIFFAVIGAEFNVNALTRGSLWLIPVLLLVAVVSKLLGCGLPASILMKDYRGGLKVGVGMISRGEVGLIIAGIGITTGVISQSLYGAVIVMVIGTTIITPIMLKWLYSRDSETRAT